MFFKNSFSIRLRVVAQWAGWQLKLGLQKVYVRRKKEEEEEEEEEIDKLDIILNFVNKKKINK
jgi:hypothetical protein